MPTTSESVRMLAQNPVSGREEIKSYRPSTLGDMRRTIRNLMGDTRRPVDKEALLDLVDNLASLMRLENVGMGPVKAGLPLLVKGEQKILPVMKRIERDRVLAMGKAPKERGTYELLQGVLQREGYDPANDISPIPLGKWKRVAIYADLLHNYFGLNPKNLGSIDCPHRIEYTIAMPAGVKN